MFIAFRFFFLFLLASSIQAAPLRDHAVERNKMVGAFGEYEHLTEDAQYRKILGSEFNLMTVGVYWYQTHMSESGLDLSRADVLADFASRAGMKMRVHPLVWWSDYEKKPQWVVPYANQPDKLKSILKDHVQGIISFFRNEYPGQVIAYDVVNEPLESLGTGPRKSIWQNINLRDKEEYIRLSFQWAHEADPEAKLFLNEIFTERNDAKFSAFYQLVKRLLAQGVPLHGVGIQGHQFAPFAARFGFEGRGPAMVLAVDAAEIESRILAFEKLGLEVHLTEVDVPILEPQALLPGVREARLQRRFARQAEQYSGITRACMNRPACKAMVFWGISDKYSWIPEYFPGWGFPLLWDGNYRPKSAYWAVSQALQP